MSAEQEKEKFYKTANVAVKVWLAVVGGLILIAAVVFLFFALLVGGCAVAVTQSVHEAPAVPAKPPKFD